MDPVEQLVDALIEGNSLKIQESFQRAISERISQALEDYRVQVAQTMFKEEQVDEVLDKSASAGEWISDFVHSDNPKFEGKSKKKRKEMALAAYYAKQRE